MGVECLDVHPSGEQSQHDKCSQCVEALIILAAGLQYVHMPATVTSQTM